jgi:hypothetical protein
MSGMAWSPTRPKPPGPPLAVAIPLLVVGVLVAIVSVVALASAILRSVSNASTLTGPGSKTVVCRSGVYLFYTESGSNVLNQGSVAVTGPGGTAVAVETETAAESVRKNGARYSGELGFTAVHSGTYVVTLSASGVTLVVAPSFGNSARQNLGWAAGVGLGLLATLAGLILLIVASVRRSGARKQAAQYAADGWIGGQGVGLGPVPQAGPQGYGWSAPPGAQVGPPGWSPPAGPPAPPSGPWARPPAPTGPPPGWPGGPGESSGPAAGPGQSPGQSGSWPQPSSKPTNPQNS